MARRIFIAHHSEDKQQVKGFILLRWNINVEFSFFDRSLVDRVKSENPDYIKRRIREQMHGTSVTVVLIGDKTHNSLWVDWEIEESYERGNGLLGIKLKGKSGAKRPSILNEYAAKVINWEPSIFEEEIEIAAKAAGR